MWWRWSFNWINQNQSIHGKWKSHSAQESRGIVISWYSNQRDWVRKEGRDKQEGRRGKRSLFSWYRSASPPPDRNKIERYKCCSGEHFPSILVSGDIQWHTSGTLRGDKLYATKEMHLKEEIMWKRCVWLDENSVLISRDFEYSENCCWSLWERADCCLRFLRIWMKK